MLVALSTTKVGHQNHRDVCYAAALTLRRNIDLRLHRPCHQHKQNGQ